MLMISKAKIKFCKFDNALAMQIEDIYKLGLYPLLRLTIQVYEGFKGFDFEAKANDVIEDNTIRLGDLNNKLFVCKSNNERDSIIESFVNLIGRESVKSRWPSELDGFFNVKEYEGGVVIVEV